MAYFTNCRPGSKYAKHYFTLMEVMIAATILAMSVVASLGIRARRAPVCCVPALERRISSDRWRNAIF